MATKKEARHVRDFENMDDARILDRVLEDIKESETFQTQYFDIFKELYTLYKSYIAEEDKKTDRSNLFIPYTFHLIETIVPKLILSIFASRPYVRTIPLGVSDNDTRTQRAKKMNMLLDWQFQTKIQLLPLVTDVIKTAAIYGTAITKQSWDFKEKEVVKRRQKTMLGIPLKGMLETVLVKTVVKDDPKVTLVNILNFLFDPAATNLDESRYCAEIYYEDYHEIKEKDKQSNGMYINLDKIKSDGSTVLAVSDTATSMLDSIGISPSKNGTKTIQIHEYWTDDWVIKVANKSVLIYSQPTPYFHRKKPFAVWKYTSIPNEFYGEGAVNPVKSLQYELNTTRNQRIDNVSFVLNKMWKILRSSNVDTTQLVSRPAGFIEVDEMADIEEIQFSDVTQSSYQEEAVIKTDMDVTSGVHDAGRGSSPDRRETATTMNILAKAGNERFQLATRLAEYGGMHEMVSQIIELNKQYIDHSKEVVILGDDGKMQPDIITPEEILGEYDIVGVGSATEPTANKEIRQTQLVQLYNIIQNRQDVNHAALLRNIFEEFDMRNIEDIFSMQPPVPQDPNAMAGINATQPASPFASATAFGGGVNNG